MEPITLESLAGSQLLSWPAARPSVATASLVPAPTIAQLWEWTLEELLKVTTTSEPAVADRESMLNVKLSPSTSMTKEADSPPCAGALVGGTTVGGGGGSVALSLTGTVAGGAVVAVALGLASSPPQAMAKSMTALKIAD